MNILIDLKPTQGLLLKPLALTKLNEVCWYNVPNNTLNNIKKSGPGICVFQNKREPDFDLL